MADWTQLVSGRFINGVSICIYSRGHVEFLRYYSIAINLTKWEATIPTGEELIVLGDILVLERIHAILKNNLLVTVTYVTGKVVQKSSHNLKQSMRPYSA